MRRDDQQGSGVGAADHSQYGWRATAVCGCFFKGANLEDELSFVAYFHSTLPNQLLHLATSVLLTACVMVALAFLPEVGCVGGVGGLQCFPAASCAVACFYTVLFSLMDVAVGVVWGLLLAGCVVGSVAAKHALSGHMSDEAVVGWSLGAAAVFGVCQGLGHVVFEKRLPAFRIFEFLVTTPMFLVLAQLFRLGYRPSLRIVVLSNAAKWAGTERWRAGG